MFFLHGKPLHALLFLLNLKLGFDLTQGENGAPALRIRDFEDSKEINVRANKNIEKKDDEDDNMEDDKSAPEVRADSSSESEEKEIKKQPRLESSKEDSIVNPPKASEQARDDNDDDDFEDDENRHSTKGLADMDTEGFRRRRKRNAEQYEALKRKGKKVTNTKKTLIAKQ